jgi:hypothetical protein
VCSACQQLSLRNSYVDILPAFNAALELTPDLVFRANWAKNLARPKPTDLVPNINCLDDADRRRVGRCLHRRQPRAQALSRRPVGGEPGLVSQQGYAVQPGLLQEYESSFVILNVLRTGVDLFQDGVTYTVRQPVNGFGALLDGIEASAQTAFTFLPAPFDGWAPAATSPMLGHCAPT